MMEIEVGRVREEREGGGSRAECKLAMVFS